MSRLLQPSAVQSYTEQLDKLIVKLRTFPEDERAAAAAAFLEGAKAELSHDAGELIPLVEVEQPTDEDGNPLPPPSPMEFPQP